MASPTSSHHRKAISQQVLDEIQRFRCCKFDCIRKKFNGESILAILKKFDLDCASRRKASFDLLSHQYVEQKTREGPFVKIQNALFDIRLGVSAGNALDTVPVCRKALFKLTAIAESVWVDNAKAVFCRRSLPWYAFETFSSSLKICEYISCTMSA